MIEIIIKERLDHIGEQKLYLYKSIITYRSN